MMIFDPVVAIPKVTYRQITRLVEEIAYMESGRKLDGFQVEREAEEFIQSIVSEYINQYFKQSTHAAAELVSQQRKLRNRRELDY